jgi:hypothetical protein
VVHGKTDQEIAAKIRESLHNQVHQLYTIFHSDLHFILSRHQYLFTSRSLARRLNMDINSLTCWLRSVEDAQKALEHHNTNLRLQSNQIFAPFYALGRARTNIPSTSSDSTYSPSSQDYSSTEDMDSLESLSLTRDDITVSTMNTSEFSHDNSTYMSSNGTFVSISSNDPPPSSVGALIQNSLDRLKIICFVYLYRNTR